MLPISESTRNLGGSRSALALMTIILLVAFGLGLPGLNLEPVWFDEFASITFMGGMAPPYSPQQIVATVSQRAWDHVPFYYLIGAGWASFVGWSQFVLRLLSLLSGVVMISWLFRFASDTIDKRTAIVAALLMSTSAFVIVYFHELRAYSLLMLLAIVHTWLYWRLLTCKRITKLTWICFTASTTALLYTHNFSLFLLTGLGVSHLLLERRSRKWLSIILAWTIGVLTFLPYLPGLISGNFTRGEVDRANSMGELAQSFALLISNGLSVLLFPLVIWLVYVIIRKRHPSVVRLVVLALTMLLSLLFVSWRFDLIAISRMRYFLLLWIPCTILIAFCLTSLPHSVGLTTAFVALWCVAGFQLTSSATIYSYAGFNSRAQQYPPLQHYTSYLHGKTGYRDYLIGFSALSDLNKTPNGYAWKPSDYYLDAQLGIDGSFLHTHLKRYRLENDVREILRDHPHILLAHDPSDVPLNYARTLGVIRAQYAPCAILVDNLDLRIQRYVHPVLGCGH